METRAYCSLPDCSAALYAKGLCNKHWQRMRKHGDPHRTGRLTPSERFWRKVAKADACWMWTGAKTPAGYGVFNLDQVATYAHRFAFEEANGISPDGAYVDHRCHSPACVNPAHLRLVTNKENAENHSGPIATNTSGVRGVYWSKSDAKWTAAVTHFGRWYSGGRYANLADAEAAVIELRNRLWTHNDIDRAGVTEALHANT